MQITHHTQTMTMNSQSILRGDHNLRRRIRSELLEVEEMLNQVNKEEPIISSLIIWHQQFIQALRLSDIQKVTHCFVSALEEIFKDPLKQETSFSHELFGEKPLPIVQFLIKKMCDHNSILYSEKLDKVAFTSSDKLEKQLIEYNKIQKERDEKEKNQFEIDVIKNKIKELEQEGEEEEEEWNFILERGKWAFSEINEEIGEMQEKVKKATENQQFFLKMADQLQQRVIHLQKEIEVLEKQNEEIKREIEEVKKESIELQIAIHRVEMTQKENQRNWFTSISLMAVSIVATWAVSQYIPGASLHFTNRPWIPKSF